MQAVTYRFLQEPEGIGHELRLLGREPELAVDLEADSLHSYREKICLVQTSTRSGNAILDPLTEREALAPLGDLLGDERILKVFHGGDYDVRLLKKDFGFTVRNLFDTMIAAQFTGREKFGLAALLEEFYEVKLDKKHQRADWGARPLGPELLSYAALDTAYLLPLRDRLVEELAGLERLAWVAEECRLLEAAEPAPDKVPSCFDIKGSQRLPPTALAVLQGLVELRDGIARRRDRPPFKVLGTPVLLEWAQNPPRDQAALERTAGVNRGFLQRWGSEILGGVERALQTPPERCPRPNHGTPRVPLTGAQERRLKRLKQLRTQRAQDLGLQEGLLINTATLERITRLAPAEVSEELPEMLKNWQRIALGEDLVAAL